VGRSTSRHAGATPAVTRDVIKETAIRLFSERGYPVIGMRDLGEAVGILPGSLYAHIESKEALLLDIVRSGVKNFTDALAPIVTADMPADERLRMAVRTHMEVLAVTLDQTRVTFHQWHYLTGERHDQMVSARQAYEDVFRTILREGSQDGSLHPRAERKVAALTIIGVLGSATEWFTPAGAASPQQLADSIGDLLLLGLS
jgi:AcrR family transcriptional regulator